MTAILGLETSCDETAAAVVTDGVHIRGNVVASQTDLHRKYGGVVPEIASRAHLERLDAVIEEALDQAELRPENLDAVAVTHRPGLVGALLVGVTAAKTLSWLWGKPLVAVDHIAAHAYSPGMGDAPPPWPAVALVASGGHTSLFLVREPLETRILGATTDDAAGEAFDKVAAILGLGFPGGPAVERAARGGNPRAVAFPRARLGPGSLDFSFSGIKTAVLYHVHGHGRTTGGLERLSPQELADTAASFQQAVIDVLVSKTMLAAKQTGVHAVLLGGGVAANGALRRALETACDENRLRFRAAPLALCTDNAAMIAGLGYHCLRAGRTAGWDLDAHASSPRAYPDTPRPQGERGLGTHSNKTEPRP